MKASKFNEEQNALALHVADQTSVDEVTRKLLGLTSNVLSMEIKVWRIVTRRSEAIKTVRRRESKDEAACGRLKFR